MRVTNIRGGRASKSEVIYKRV